MLITWSDRLKLAALGALSALLPLTFIPPAQAAERVYLEYGAFERSVSVQQLADFAETGAITPELRLFLGRFSPEQRSQLRDVLRARYSVSASMVDSLSYSASGEQLLTEIGGVIRTQSRLNGLHSLRAAGILAASDANGLSILEFLRHLPTDMRIDVGELLQRFRQIRGVLSDTTRMTRAIEQEAVAIAATESAAASTPDFSQMPDLRQPGPYRFIRQTLTVDDPTRQRSLTVDLYLPSLDLPGSHSSAQPSGTGQAHSIPVIVVSNGLGARRDYFEELAAHLASYGLAIAIPDHPGSDREYLRGFFSGLYPENFAPSEFVE
ncbi:MAG TPA: alpha/beta hydrolase, partial [Chroococcidiopsis sp.]